MTTEQQRPVEFQAHIEILRLFLALRDAIVERIQALLNAQLRPTSYLEDRVLLARQFEDCFFLLSAVPREFGSLRGQLQQVHWANGFKPRQMPGIPNEMFDPADMMVRAFNLWRQTRWPGRNGRIRYAQTLFNLYVVRCLTLLGMRWWDAGPGPASKRLAQSQILLDQLWKDSPKDQPVLVRDVRWLIPVAQSPTTDELGPYFEIAQQVAESLSDPDRLEIHRASVVLAGGHLRSQLRHFTMQGRVLDEPDLILSTRGSNALDCAMTIQGLVPLLKAYEMAVQGGQHTRRLELASAICQGISADPELFVNRVDLLRAYSMVEHLFIATDDAGRVGFTQMGRRHVLLAQEYGVLIGRLASLLHEDCPRFRPVCGAYSPYGAMYGFSSNILEHMALKAIDPEAERRFSLEDAFAEGDVEAAKLAWVSGWRRLPHMSREVQQLYEYPQQFAEQIFARIKQALQRHATGGAPDKLTMGRLYIDAADIPDTGATAASVPWLPVKFVKSSDPGLVAARQAEPLEQARLLGDRREGMYLVSWQTLGGWVGISKDVLTAELGAGRDVRVAGLPPAAVRALELMYQHVMAK